MEFLLDGILVIKGTVDPRFARICLQRSAIPSSKALCRFDDVGGKAITTVSDEVATAIKGVFGIIAHARDGEAIERELG